MNIIGFTTGVFDMFHIGHLNLLENAKSKCDFLVVGVNSDKLVSEYKSKNAVVPFEERLRIVSAMRCVDEAIRVDTLDKESIYMTKLFNVLFIGDDWKGSQRWAETERVMLTYGVRTIYLPYTRSTNSTLLREKLIEY